MAIWARRLHLEHAHRVGPAEHVVHLVLLRDGGQVDVDVAVDLAHEVDAAVQHLEHPEAEQVELHQPDGGAVVLVPLEHRADRLVAAQRLRLRGGAGEARPLHRAHLHDGPVADHHAAGVDAEVPGRVLELGGQRQHVGGDVLLGRLLLGGDGHAAPGVGLLRPGVLLAGGVAERLGDVADRRLGAVGDDVGHLGGVAAAVLGVDVLDRLLPPARLDVDVDVGRAVALGRQEPLEEQAELTASALVMPSA